MTLMTAEEVDCIRQIGRTEGGRDRTTIIGQAELDALCDSHDKLLGVVEKINELRNDAVGLQSCGISSFLYPLVAILGDAGIEGEGYDVARPRINTIFTQRDEALKLLTLAWRRIRHKSNPFEGEHNSDGTIERINELVEQFKDLQEKRA